MVLQRDLERGIYPTPVKAYLLRLCVEALMNTWVEKKHLSKVGRGGSATCPPQTLPVVFIFEKVRPVDDLMDLPPPPGVK